MLIDYKRGQGSIVLRIKILNSSVATGAGLTGLTSASSGLIISTIADNESTATAYTGANIETITTLGTFAAPTSGKVRFKEVDATNHKGVYEIQIADARYAVSSAKSLLVSVCGATNCAETDATIPLRDINPYSANQFMTGVNAISPPANWNLLSIDASGRMDLGKWIGSAPDALSSGKVPADLKLWLTSAPAALTTNGYVQSALLRWLTDNAAGTPNALVSNRPDVSVGSYPGNTAQTGDAYARLGAPAGASVSADIAGVQSDTNDIQTRIPASLDANGNMKSAPQPDYTFTVQSGSNTTTTLLTNFTDAVDDLYKGYTAVVLSGTYAKFKTTIKAYNGTTFYIQFDDATPVTLANSVTVGLFRSGTAASQFLAAVTSTGQKLWVDTDGGVDIGVNADAYAPIFESYGLLGKHVGLRNTSYTGNNLMSYDLCIYDNATNAGTNDGTTGLVHKYSVVNTYSGSNLTSSVTTRIS